MVSTLPSPPATTKRESDLPALQLSKSTAPEKGRRVTKGWEGFLYRDPIKPLELPGCLAAVADCPGQVAELPGLGSFPVCGETQHSLALEGGFRAEEWPDCCEGGWHSAGQEPE